MIGDQAKSVVQASMDLGQLDREMALVRDNHRENSRGLMELWVNQVLDPSAAGQPRYEPLKTDAMTLKGLLGHGLARVELRGAGLSDDGIDRLYRSLYVYTIGFFDVMQDILNHSEFRVEILGNVWRAYLKIAESALKVAFKSEYLQLFQSQQITAAELLVAKEALAEAKLDSYNTEKALAWLTAAHAEERALRVSVRAQLNDVQSRLDLEQRAHQSAVLKYVQEVEAAAKLKAALDNATSKLMDSALSHAELIRQRDVIQSDFNAMEDKCVFVFEEIKDVVHGLLMDESLSCPKDLRDAALNDQGLQGVKSKATVLKLLAVQMHSKWQAQTTEFRSTSLKLNSTRDELRTEKSIRYDTTRELEAAKSKIAKLEAVVVSSEEKHHELSDRVALLESQLSEALKGKAEAEDSSSKHQAAYESLGPVIQATTLERDELKASLLAVEATVPPLEHRIAELEVSLQGSEWLKKEMSKALACVMPSLEANQTARRFLQKAVKKEREEIEAQGRRMEELKRNIRVQEGQLDDLAEELKEKDQELQNMKRVAKENLKLVDDAQQIAFEKTEAAALLTTQLGGIKRENERLASELSASTSALASTEKLQKADKAEVMRLYSSLQGLEAQVQQGADDRMELVRKLDRQQQQGKLLEDKARRKEEMLSVEAKRLEAEIEMERARMESMELQLESHRKHEGELEDALARKREKKKRWKAQTLERDEQLLHLERMLESRTSLIENLEERLRHVDVDLAVLVADRGRELPRYQEGEEEDAEGADDNYSALPPAPPLPVIPPHLLPPDLQPVDGAVSTIQTNATAMDVQRMYDEVNRQAISIQISLDGHDTVLEEARRAYEKARAVFHVNPTDPQLRTKMEAKEAELRAARVIRTDLEKQVQELSDVSRALQARIRHHDYSLNNKRMKEIERRTGQRDASVRSEVSLRCDEADARAREVTELLAKQRVAYDMLSATRNALDIELQQQEQELQEGLYRMQRVTGEKIELESNLRQARTLIQHLQESIQALNVENEKLNKQILSNDFEVERIKREGVNSMNSAQVAMRHQGDKFTEEIVALKKSFSDERSSLESDISELKFLHKESLNAKEALEKSLKSLTNAYLSGIEYEDPPDFFSHFADTTKAPAWDKGGDTQRGGSVCVSASGGRPMHPDLFRSVLGTLPQALTPPCNFALGREPVVDFIAMPLDTTIVLISQLLVEKMIADLKGEESSLGGQPGPRVQFNLVVYEFFIARFGPRQSSEMHIAAFLASVQKHKKDHPKVRMFARLTGQDDLGLGSLPRASLDLYVALLNRVHARAGPLTGEASEGTSFVKCRLVAKAMRDMLRGSYSSLCDEAGNITEYLMQLSGGNEEQPLDLDLALELSFKAWLKQYRLDYDAIMGVYQAMFNTGRAKIICQDEFVDFLKQLNGPKLLTLTQHQIASMFRQASISDGPQPSQSRGSSFVQAVLDQGFVGISSHLSLKLEPVSSLPPYDEFRLLEDAWRNLRPVIDAQMSVLKNNEDKIYCDIAEYMEDAQGVEMALDERSSPAKAWSRFRKLMSIYLGYKKQCDKILPFTDPGSGRMAMIRMSELGAVQRVTAIKKTNRSLEMIDEEGMNESIKGEDSKPFFDVDEEDEESGQQHPRTLMSQPSTLFGRAEVRSTSPTSVRNLRVKSVLPAQPQNS